MSRFLRNVSAAAAWVAGCKLAMAVNTALGPNGSQINLAKQQFTLTGNGTRVGQVETGRPGDADVALPGQPAVSEPNHPAVNPAGVASIGAAPIGGQFVDRHATEVAGMMVSSDAVFRGAAHQASLYSSALGFGPQDQQLAVLATEWVRAQGGGVRTINMSFGLGLDARYYPAAPAARDGRSMFSMYVDYAARANNVLFVQAAPELGPTKWSTPDDAYNSIVVSFTRQATQGTGRFDRVDPGALTNMVGAHGVGIAGPNNRTKIDVVAPGDYLVLPVPGGAFTRDTFTDTNASGAWTHRDIDADVSGLFDPNEPYLDVDGSGTFNAGDLFEDRNFNGVRDDAPNADYYAQPSAAAPLPAGRSEPVQDVDGDGIMNLRANAVGSSFAAPMVTGLSALMDERAATTGASTDRRVKKAVIMNAASKHVLDNTAAAATAWPIAYAARNADPMNIAAPLDPQMGLGQVNGVSTMRQYRQNQSDLGVRLDSVEAAGGADIKDLALNGGNALKAGALVSATLVWERIITNADNNLTRPASYDGAAPVDLDLHLVKLGPGGGPVARSRATVDNVEHIYFNVPSDGRYAVRVANFGAEAAEYALAVSAGSTDGLNFSVTAGAAGRPGGVDGNPFPNDVSSLGTAGAAAFQTQGEIFTSGGDRMNMQRLSGVLQTRSRIGPHNAPPAAMAVIDGTQRGVLGLRTNDTAAGTDDLAGLSWGTDGTANPKDPAKPLGSTLVFSLVGEGQLRKSRATGPFGAYPSDILFPAAVGNVVHKLAADLGLANTDDLDALELDSVFKDIDGAGGPRAAVDGDGDGMHNAHIYFLLRRNSPSLGGGQDAGDIFVSRPPDTANTFDLTAALGFTYATFAEGEGDVGLAAGDELDALVLSDIDTFGTLDKAKDLALFSLTAGSPSVTGGMADAGAVYMTDFNRAFDPTKMWADGGSIFATAAALGIGGMDLDALDIQSVPEPGALMIVAAMAGLAVRRRRRA